MDRHLAPIRESHNLTKDFTPALSQMYLSIALPLLLAERIKPHVEKARRKYLRLWDLLKRFNDPDLLPDKDPSEFLHRVRIHEVDHIDFKKPDVIEKLAKGYI